MSEQEVTDSSEVPESTPEISTADVAEKNEATNAVNEDENVGDAPGDTSSQEKMGKAFAATKKKYREIGRQEGLAQAQQYADQALSNDGASEASYNEPVAQEAAPAYNAGGDPVWINKANSIDAEGKAKYPDFEEKFRKEAAKAQNNPTLLSLYQYAIGVGNAETVYDIMNNAEKRARMLDDPSCWSKELFNLSSSKGKEVVKTPPPPLDELKTAPAKGKRSHAEEKAWVLHNHGLR